MFSIQKILLSCVRYTIFTHTFDFIVLRIMFEIVMDVGKKLRYFFRCNAEPSDMDVISIYNKKKHLRLSRIN